jgi:hypothetical protein
MVSNATARAAVHKPTQPLASEAAESALKNASIAASRLAPSNEEESTDTAVRLLAGIRDGYIYDGSDGSAWSRGVHGFSRDSVDLANIDQCLSGLIGVLEVMHAGQMACDEFKSALGSVAHDRLSRAARALAYSAENSIDSLRARLGEQ